ncbi:HK97 gp10 family phage protein [Tepidamorphus gemmatus]|uniref:HK97 gp10 family phage protein n=1 Tax=Tepidamorphus gemmatus TaxID=747076 RepID=A0A4R3MGJ7_9HYPH|nr:HK97-gp10 family putative phage morphogenesis protein [Tepidamorphus gemmatus]TCT12666.1 HK97 gp10 family phage protein [Tepidamorphus gemmatus]
MADQLDRLSRRLEAIPKRVREAVQPALKASGDELVNRMRQLAPEDTGALRDPIEATPAGRTTPAYSQPGGSRVVPENSVVVTAGNSDVRYPHLVEYGTATAPAQPFFWPAFRLTRKRIETRIKRAISKAVREGWTR